MAKASWDRGLTYSTNGVCSSTCGTTSMGEHRPWESRLRPGSAASWVMRCRHRRAALEMLEKLAPRLKREDVPLSLSLERRYRNTDIDVDVLEACLELGIKVADPPGQFDVTFEGWLSANADHPLRNQDIVESARDERFKAAIMRALEDALACCGGAVNRGFLEPAQEQRAFPLAARDRPGIKDLWRSHTAGLIATLEQSGLASFEAAHARLKSTLWPDALRLFPDLAERLKHLDPVATLRRTLQAGVFDEYGLPALERTVEEHGIKAELDESGTANLHLTFPAVVMIDTVHAFSIRGNGGVKKYELRLPKKREITTIVSVGEDLAVSYRDDKFDAHFYWVSNPGSSTTSRTSTDTTCATGSERQLCLTMEASFWVRTPSALGTSRCRSRSLTFTMDSGSGA